MNKRICQMYLNKKQKICQKRSDLIASLLLQLSNFELQVRQTDNLLKQKTENSFKSLLQCCKIHIFAALSNIW